MNATGAHRRFKTIGEDLKGGSGMVQGSGYIHMEESNIMDNQGQNYQTMEPNIGNYADSVQ